MTSYPPTDDSASGLDRSSHRSDSSSVNIPILAAPSEEAKNKSHDVVGHPQGRPNDMSAQPASRIASPELSENSSQHTGIPLVDMSPNHNNHTDPETGNSVGTDRSVQGQGHDDAHPRYRKLTWKAWSAFIVGLLLAIIVPGLIVGIVTKQVAWGIATSGPVAAVGVSLGDAFLRRRE